MLFAQLTQLFVRLYNTVEVQLRIPYRVIASLKVLVTSPAILSSPPAPILPPATKTFPILIPGTAALGSGLYTPPLASLLLLIFSLVISSALLYGTAKRLGLLDEVAKVFDAIATDALAKIYTSTSVITSKAANANDLIARGVYNLYTSTLHIVTQAPIEAANIARAVKHLARNPIQAAATVSAPFANVTLKVFDSEELILYLDLVFLVITFNVSAYAIIQPLAAKHWRQLRLWRHSPRTSHTFVPGIPVFWDGRLPQSTVPRKIPTDGELWGCSSWKIVNSLGFVPKIKASGLRAIQPLGQGTFGLVMEAETKKGMRVAIKRINKRPAGRRRQKTKIKTAWTNLLAEVEIPLLMEGNSASLKVLGVWCDDGHFYVAMELAQLLEKELSPRNIYMYGRQLLCGVRALHRMGIIHLDIKPDNLLRTGGTLKIIDFGLSQRLNAVQPHFWAHHEGGYDRLQGPSGTPGFMSPLVQSSFYSFDADLWSAGVTLYQWMTKRDSPPEFEETTGVLSDFREDNFTDVQYDFFDRIFSTTPPHRFQTWEEVLGHKIWPELFSNRHSRTL